MSEAKPGEFTLVYNSVGGVVHPVAMTPEQHELLQYILQVGLDKIRVMTQIEVKYG